MSIAAVVSVWRDRALAWNRDSATGGLISSLTLVSVLFLPCNSGVAGIPSSDFNGDGFEDLAVGVPLDDIGTIKDAGSVHVFYGGAGGLSGRNEIWHLNSTGVPDAARGGDKFGSALTWGDFNRDGYADLAVGAPYRKAGGKKQAGKVYVLYGSAGGLSAQGSQGWSQGGSGDLADAPDVGDWFGAALAAGDLDGDGFDDLVVGAPREDVENTSNQPKWQDLVRLPDAGAFSVIFGAVGGLGSGRGSIFWNQDSGGGASWAEPRDCHGFSLASGGDLDADGMDDLAIGAPCEHTGGGELSGFNYGSTDANYGHAITGLDVRRELYIRQWASWVEGEPNADDAYGFAVVMGDFNGDGIGDLAIGGPGEDLGGKTEAGEVLVFYGRVGVGLKKSLSVNELWDLNRIAGDGTRASGDLAGAALATGDFNGDGRDDLAIGVPQRDVDGKVDAGEVRVLYGRAGGLSRTGNQRWHQNLLAGAAAGRGDAFGHTLYAGDYDGDGIDDLAIGVPGENIGNKINAGAVNVLFGSAGTGLSSNGAQLLHRDGQNVTGSAAGDDQFGGSQKPVLRNGQQLLVVEDDSGAGGPPPAGGQTPFGGNPWPVPGTVEAENYDEGGEGSAWHDTTAGNKGGVYRNDDVDIWSSASEGNYTGANISGEWTEYTVDVSSAGQYTVLLRIATPKSGKRLHIEFDGVDKTGTINIPNTGGWQSWQTVTASATLAAGQQVMRLVVDSGGLNINRIEFQAAGGGPGLAATPTITPSGGSFSGPVVVTLASATAGATIHYTTNGSTPDDTSPVYRGAFTLAGSATVKAIAIAGGLSDSAVARADFTIATGGSGGQQPFGGAPGPVPGVLEVEDYDMGGEGVAWHDTTAANKGGAYRNDSVDLWESAIEGVYKGANVSGEWTEYTVDVASAGQYTVLIRVATPKSGKRLHIEASGINVTGPVNIPNTGGWQSWQTVSATATLDAGRQVLRLVMDTGALNINWIEFQAAGGGPGTVATPTITPQGGAYTDSVTVSLASATQGAVIYYTTGGGTPNRNSSVFGGPFTLTESATVKAVATAGGLNDSAVAQASFTIITGGGGGQQPFGGVPVAVPGRIEMEDYDTGGEGVAWHDTTVGNASGIYRSDDVDIWNTTDSGLGGYIVGANATGEWREYTVSVAAAGQYLMDLRVATPKDGRMVHVEVNGVNVTGNIAVPSTGGWEVWQTITVPITLGAGEQALRFVIDGGGMSLNWIEIR